MISLLSCDYNTQFCRFFIDTEAELKDLPAHSHGGAIENTHLYCAIGSIAECLNGKMYRLSGEDKWVEVKNTSSGSSGGSNTPSSGEEDIEPISNEDIDSLFDK